MTLKERAEFEWEKFKFKTFDTFNLRIEKITCKFKLKVLDWRESWKHKIVDWLDVIHEAIKLHESKKSWWDRWGKRLLRVCESVLNILAKFL